MEKQLNEQEEMKGTELSSTSGDKQTSTRQGGRWSDPMVAATIVVALATAIYTVFSFFLWQATQTSVELTKESLKLNREAVDVSQKTFSEQYRPYLGVTSLEIEKGEGDTLLTILVPIKNFGAVPAQNIDIKMNRIFDGVSMTTKINIGLNNLTLFPQETFKARQIWKKTDDESEPELPKLVKIEFEVHINYEGIEGRKGHTYGKWKFFEDDKEDMYTLQAIQQTFK